MKRTGTLSQARSQARAFTGGASPASQTLVRGLDVLEMVATGPLALPALAHRLGLARSTAHRLATALLERRYLTLVPREGYGLGPKLLELGFCAREQTILVRIARPYLQALAAETRDCVHLSIRDAGTALLIERVEGKRRLLPMLRIGERAKLTGCAAGSALLLDGQEAAWRAAFAQDCGSAQPEDEAALRGFVQRQFLAARLGYSVEPAETDDRVRSVAAPVRGADGAILAAIGVSAAAQYMEPARIPEVARAVCSAAALISSDLGLHAALEGPSACGVALPKGGRRAQGNSALAAASAEKPLEAKASRGHDPFINGAGRAEKPDLGVT